jgi:hypothetical protein
VRSAYHRRKRRIWQARDDGLHGLLEDPERPVQRMTARRQICSVQRHYSCVTRVASDWEYPS